MPYRETAQDRVKEALARLSREAQNVSRQSQQGQLIEALGCTLSGRKGSWWPDERGNAPEVIEAFQPKTYGWTMRDPLDY